MLQAPDPAILPFMESTICSSCLTYRDAWFNGLSSMEEQDCAALISHPTFCLISGEDSGALPFQGSLWGELWLVNKDQLFLRPICICLL